MGQIAHVAGGGTPRTNDPANYEEGQIPWITPADLSGYSDKYISEGARNITEQGLASSSARLLPEGTVLFSSRAPIGYVAIATQPVATNQGFKSFVMPNEIDPSYVYHYLRRAKDIIVSMASGTTFLEISGAKAAEIPIPIAPLAEQRRIVAEIETQFTRLGAAVAALERARAKLKRYRAAVLAAAFSGQLVPKEADLSEVAGESFESGEEHLEQLSRHRCAEWQRHRAQSTSVRGEYPEPRSVQHAIDGENPRGWVTATIDQIAVVVRGASPRPAGDPRYFGGTIPWITVGSLTKDNKPYLRDVTEFVTEAGRAASRFIQPGTFLLTNSGATLGVPKITLIGGCINDGSVALLFLPDHLKLFLWMYLSSLTPRLRMINQGAAQPNLNTTIVKSIEVPVPPRAEVVRIVTEVERRLSVADEIEVTITTSLKRVERFRQSILRKAFAGQLVPQDPTDEPASVLLERIRAERALKPTKRSRIASENEKGQYALW
jgi:type I restriction enzyme S subunit